MDVEMGVDVNGINIGDGQGRRSENSSVLWLHSMVGEAFWQILILLSTSISRILLATLSYCCRHVPVRPRCSPKRTKANSEFNHWSAIS